MILPLEIIFHIFKWFPFPEKWEFIVHLLKILDEKEKNKLHDLIQTDLKLVRNIHDFYLAFKTLDCTRFVPSIKENLYFKFPSDFFKWKLNLFGCNYTKMKCKCGGIFCKNYVYPYISGRYPGDEINGSPGFLYGRCLADNLLLKEEIKEWRKEEMKEDYESVNDDDFYFMTKSGFKDSRRRKISRKNKNK